MIRAMIVDDEPHAQEELQALLQEIGGCEVVACCSNGFEALKQINQLQPEVLFLDVQMPVLSGFDLLTLIEDAVMPLVVFITAYDDYALKAFEENTLDYLLKPVARERLEKTLTKLKNTLRAEEKKKRRPLVINRIPCLCRNRIKLIDPDDIDYARSSASGVTVITPQGEFFTDLTLKLLEDRTQLLRCHKQYLVNVARIDEINLHEGGGAEVKTRDTKNLPVSRRYLKNLKDALSL